MKYDVIIIDALNICHKYSWVHRTFKDKKGRKTGMYYGVLNFVRGLYKKHNAKIIFLWDSPKLKKKMKDKNYKADRQKQKDNFYKQIEKLKKMLSYYGVIQCCAFGYEADDIASKLVNKYDNKNILLVSNDSDWWQLLSNNIRIMKGTDLLKEDDILEAIGIHNINDYPIYLAIIGTHNNVKGISRINKKHVVEIINICNCESIDDLFDYPHTYFPENIRNTYMKIIDNEKLIRRNYDMAKFIDRGYKIEKIDCKKNMKKFIDICKSYNMYGFIRRLIEDNGLEVF